ncbi:ABC transporter substrate-binding protein [Pseudonocardia endophytica]|uniref:Thiamine pyrimidine synthase n=1 Tax=Pseudonocardia endophytica TaxID=401976 RepID=A0A4R1HVT9_PSEEN|nr:ABC transporter substrate-binding protein [Pseudonocardia endophytica]TCK24840.1 ABC-type nitrate/sulfonate/bicarbonate transport system substrate-binding protein [Pseudonocardia endophytica]
MSRTRSLVITALLAVVAVVLAGCSSAQDGGGSGDPRTIRVALDWTPNTNHTGLYVAQQLGWFRDAGLDVEILPYNQTSPDTLVANGAADFGISFQDSFTYSKATGADITSVMAILQHWATEIAVRADNSAIRTPRDLDSKTYAGFGEPGEQAKMAAVIKDAGGRGDFQTVQLGTSAYEALYAGQADFTEPFVAWEGIEAQLRGEPLRTFRYTDYGFPDAYNVLLIGNSTWLRDNPDEAKAFVQAAQRGYQLAADDPAQGARLLSDANPGAFTDPRLVQQSSAMLAQRYLKDERGRVGTQTLQRWAGYSGFAYDSGSVVGPDGKPVTRKPDFSTWFTNDYLSPAGAR